MHPRIEEVLAYLDTTRSDLWKAVEEIPAARREERPGADRWSLAEVLEHLAIIEGRIVQVLSGRIAAATAEGLGPEQETGSVLDTIDRALIVDRSRRVTAPDAVRPRSSISALAAWSALERSRVDLRAAVLAGDGLALGDVMHQHPVLGRLNLYQWIIFVGGHEARHTSQIREIATEFASRSSAEGRES